MRQLEGALPDFHAIIPAGGVGSRLWPLSRAEAPKFLHDLTGTGRTLLRETWERILPLTGGDRIMVVTGRAHRAAVEKQLPEIMPANMVLESEPKESSAAIGLAAAILHRRNPDVIVGSFAADHVITDAERFRRTVAEAVAVARTGLITTIGITPLEPSIGFGYIHCGAPLEIEGAPRAELVDRFVEKPDLETATQYVRSGDYLWNAGMFISRADRLLDELARTQPELHEGLVEIAAAWDTDQRDDVVDAIWPLLSKIAIDYSVAEPAAEAGRLAVVRGDFPWDDVGDFSSLAKLLSGGRPGDLAILGEGARVLADSSSGVVVSQSPRLISLIGVTDIVVVDTPDALLVTTREHAQRVKAVVDAIKSAGRNDLL
ncbi:MAG: mannose-1-phosphate guanylyltransferase [Microcella sp.]|uniref:mannose-1-phosphate guanylyltransferase n=1 Tax=Microcella sp. TaxID=1913979 RepID=UPI002726DBC8|nr:mannose-1-phosphate guanylyltransferase [Microcella sp.]MDO8338328.1 mannose-1-phosphate guanylyltransferase [Microcella sp.]